MSRPCSGTRKDGEPCGGFAIGDGDRCYAHAPEVARQRAAARRRGGQARRAPLAVANGAAAVSLQTAAEVLELLEGAAADAQQLPNGERRGRLLGYLAGVALKALEQTEIEERIRALEERLA